MPDLIFKKNRPNRAGYWIKIDQAQKPELVLISSPQGRLLIPWGSSEAVPLDQISMQTQHFYWVFLGQLGAPEEVEIPITPEDFMELIKQIFRDKDQVSYDVSLEIKANPLGLFWLLKIEAPGISLSSMSDSLDALVAVVKNKLLG